MSSVAAAARRPGVVSTVWRNRTLLRSLVLRDLKVKYQRSALGFVWTLLNPLLTLVVLVSIFSFVIRLPIRNYWAFLISGYFVWNYLQQTLSAGSFTLAQHANVSRSVPFPTEVLILSTAISRLIEFATELALVIVILALAHHQGLPASFALVPVLIVLQLALAVGLELPIATLSVFYKDVQHALPVALTTLFYLSPVFYPAEMVPENLQPLYFANPVAFVLTLYHSVLYEGRLPGASFLIVGSAGVLLITVIGYAIFSRYKHIFPEII